MHQNKLLSLKTTYDTPSSIMKSLFCIMSIFLGIGSCQSTQKVGNQLSTQAQPGDSTTNSIIRDTVTNSQGVKLVMAYNNANHTAMFVLEGEAMQLKQDSTASGIKYSNAEYEYTEHQGNSTLRKENKIVFKNQ